MTDEWVKYCDWWYRRQPIGPMIKKAETWNFAWAYSINKVIVYSRAVSVEWCLQSTDWWGLRRFDVRWSERRALTTRSIIFDKRERLEIGLWLAQSKIRARCSRSTYKNCSYRAPLHTTVTQRQCFSNYYSPSSSRDGSDSEKGIKWIVSTCKRKTGHETEKAQRIFLF